MEVSGELKRRHGSDENSGDVESPEIPSPGAKRLRPDDLFLDILDDDNEAGEQDLASVMRSLEAEIGVFSPSPALDPAAESVAEHPDLGFLFEASDDELGLPPTLPTPSDEGFEATAEAEAEATEGTAGSTDFGQIWGFEDDIGGFGGFGEMMARPENGGGVAGVGGEEMPLFDGGLFDLADEGCGSAEFPDVAWRSESLPAV